jgi:flavodoxin
MKTLVIYYSFEGNSALVAEQIRAAAGADIIRLEMQDDKKRTGLAKYLWGIKLASANRKVALKPFSVNLDDYKTIIMGGPVWAGSPAPALKAFLEQADIKGKKLAFFLCHKGGKGQAPKKLKHLLPGNEIIGEIDFVQPSKQESRDLAEKVAAWVKTLEEAGASEPRK